ncbi:very-short-patch-repair endonuclease [Oceanobacillus iheyensis HTE831]|uniref:Very short patch repair endonuclease n=1 Tax=Oceanobacillus iheyensis (strain DSM 14371 / CIP 107618 / JCM 11309 / KCTC 3954 / HTE831) TaxID=221109 RepID=Q8EL90_OCEIH|nr:very short patch repair endonuclease [Oceanobacillus iheyensis]BAC15297.1 very-short-patch-repair endonuclease [Oceanobacillus iheyensis HTE831]
MSDIMTKQQRSNNMKAIKSVSKLESIVSKKLWARGFRFRRNTQNLFGKPDISIKKYKIVIFIDSCFWHQCPLHANMPKSHTDYWEKKLERNKERDQEVNNYYSDKGWYLKRIWEHEIKNDIDKVIQDTAEFITLAQTEFR